MAIRIDISPRDPALQQIHRRLDLNFLILQYPWADDETAMEAVQHLEELQLDEEQREQLNEAVAEAVRNRTSDLQMLNNVTDLLLREAGIYRAHEAFYDSAIHADLASLQNGVTTQHWLTALKDLDKQDVNELSDGYTVTHWHKHARSKMDFHIRLTHKHWWETDKTQYIQMTAYRAAEFRTEDDHGEAVGSAIVLWPWT